MTERTLYDCLNIILIKYKARDHPAMESHAGRHALTAGMITM